MACCSCFGPSASSAGFSPNGKKYSRELQSFSELIYDAGNKDEGRLGGYGSTSGLLRRRNGPEINMGPTYERHRSAVDDLQDTLRDMSHHERDKLLRTDLLLLAPIVRELFPELPEMHYSYVLPYADDLDEKASDYLSSVLESIRLDLGTTVVPLHTTGDGNCLLHAVSRGIWGVELFSDLLRQKVSQELEDHQAWYESKLSRAEVTEAIEQVRQPYRFLSNLHIVALAHVIRRPIILYASHQAVLDFGFGYYGTAGMFGPVRYDVDAWYPRPIAIGWASREHNHFVSLVWSASQTPVEWPVQDEGPRAPHLSRTKSFDMQDPFAVPAATRALLRARAKGTPVAQPVFVQRLVEQIRQQVVQLQGHMLAHMIDSGAFDKSSDEEDDWASLPIKPPPASSIALSFAPYQEHPNPLLDGRNHAFDFERGQPNGHVSETPEYFANPVYNPAESRQSGATSSGFTFDPFEPSPGVNNPFLYQLPRSGTSYSDSAPVSWPPPKHSTQNAPAAVTRAQSSVQHSNCSSHVPPVSVQGKLSLDPHVYQSKQHDFRMTPTASSTTSLRLETSPASSPKQADRSPRTPRRGSVLNPLSELNPLTDPENFKQSEKVDASHVTRPDSKPAGADRPAQSADAPPAAGARRRTSEEPLVGPVVKRTARLLSADPHSQPNAHRRWKKASNTVRGAVRMRRTALAVKVELPAGLKGSVPWWNLSKDEGRLKVLEGEDPYVRAQAISRSLSKRTRVSQSNEPSNQEGRNPGVSEGDSSKAVVAVRQQNSELAKKARVDGLVGKGQYLKDGKGRLVWVSLAKQITRKMNGVAVADAALRILAKPCPAHRYAAAASRQPEIAVLAGTMVRLAAELKVLTTKPIPGIRVFLPNEDDLFLWHAVLDGPPGTPWEGRSLQLEIHVPEDYPRRPPDRVRFLTEIVHPKIDAAGVPRLDFLNVRSHGRAGKRTVEQEMLESENSHSVGVKSQGANGMASTSVGQAETGCPRSEMQGSGLGESEGAEKCTADEIVEAADRLLSAASLGTETGSENGRSTGLDGSSESGAKMRGTTWDPYQGLAFVLKCVQRLLSDVDVRQSD